MAEKAPKAGEVVDEAGKAYKLVPVAAQPEMFSQDVTLDDGTILKLRVVVTKVSRIDGLLDAEGNPVYVVQATTLPNVVGRRS